MIFFLRHIKNIWRQKVFLAELSLKICVPFNEANNRLWKKLFKIASVKPNLCLFFSSLGSHTERDLFGGIQGRMSKEKKAAFAPCSYCKYILMTIIPTLWMIFLGLNKNHITANICQSTRNGWHCCQDVWHWQFYDYEHLLYCYSTF